MEEACAVRDGDVRVDRAYDGDDENRMAEVPLVLVRNRKYSDLVVRILPVSPGLHQIRY